MHIGLATEVLTNPHTGIENALRQLIGGLSTTEHTITCFHSRDPRHPSLPEVRHQLFRKPLPIPFYHRLTAFFHRRCFESVDVLHVPHPQMPYFRKPDVPVVLTVYDISPILMPQFHNWKRVLFFKKFLPFYLAGVDRIIASSRSTRADLVRHLSIPEEKISVVYLSTALPPPGAEEERKPFILYLGTLEPRKNLPGLLLAYSRARARGLSHKLVIAGKKGWKYRPAFEVLSELHLEEHVVYKGYVTDEEKSRLYREASLFVYPSFYEGFGLPVLEAMAHGLPVVASNVSSLPEVVGDAGLLVDPRDPDQLAQAILDALDPARRDLLARKGRERARGFTAERMTRDTLAVYEAVTR